MLSVYQKVDVLIIVMVTLMGLAHKFKVDLMSLCCSNLLTWSVLTAI